MGNSLFFSFPCPEKPGGEDRYTCHCKKTRPWVALSNSCQSPEAGLHVCATTSQPSACLTARRSRRSSLPLCWHSRKILAVKGVRFRSVTHTNGLLLPDARPPNSTPCDVSYEMVPRACLPLRAFSRYSSLVCSSRFGSKKFLAGYFADLVQRIRGQPSRGTASA